MKPIFTEGNHQTTGLEIIGCNLNIALFSSLRLIDKFKMLMSFSYCNVKNDYYFAQSPEAQKTFLATLLVKMMLFRSREMSKVQCVLYTVYSAAASN